MTRKELLEQYLAERYPKPGVDRGCLFWVAICLSVLALMMLAWVLS